jgi:outer membrane protein assembly factor BamB
LDTRDGAIRWIATYPRVEEETIAAFNKRQQNGPNPCLFHDGLVLAAPTDGDRLLAYDAETGVLKWGRELFGRPPQLMGVAGSRLVAAGDFLWGLDVDTGRVLWCDGRSDPEASTCGRGVLAGDLVYWPRREEIRLVEIATGKAVRQIDMARQHGLYGGGNLTIAGGLLLVAKSDRLVAFGEFGLRKKPTRDEFAWRARIRNQVHATAEQSFSHGWNTDETRITNKFARAEFIHRQIESHGWLGNPTDEKTGF